LEVGLRLFQAHGNPFPDLQSYSRPQLKTRAGEIHQGRLSRYGQAARLPLDPGRKTIAVCHLMARPTGNELGTIA
jgi:hypothetical protein